MLTYIFREAVFGGIEKSSLPLGLPSFALNGMVLADIPVRDIPLSA